MHSTYRFRLAEQALLAAFAMVAMPLCTAAAQELPRAQVTRDDITIRAMRYSMDDQWILARAEAGSVYDILAVEGDRANHVASNWYLVVLPSDAWGTRWVGWISGRNVTVLPPIERPSTAVAESAATVVEMPARAAAGPAAPPPSNAAPASPAAAAVPRPIQDVVLRFAFDRSDLSEAAKHTLDTALVEARAADGVLAFVLGGHTDATGPDTYNHKLGLARAEAVRQYLVERLQVPVDRVSVSSFGETQPAAPNDTRMGRAENRRVVVRVSALGSR
jgi:OOP family OmpA-OmpF porin